MAPARRCRRSGSPPPVPSHCSDTRTGASSQSVAAGAWPAPRRPAEARASRAGGADPAASILKRYPPPAAGHVVVRSAGGGNRRLVVLRGGQGQNRTVDTQIFSLVLYQLSYLAVPGSRRGDTESSRRRISVQARPPGAACNQRPAARVWTPDPHNGGLVAGPGSAGNVIAALASFFVPGLGQLIQGRVLKAIVMFVLAGVIWVVSLGTLGWVIHVWSVIDAALWKPSY